jgi:hypothetical protein
MLLHRRNDSRRDCGAVTPDTDDNQEPIYKVTLKSGGIKTYTWHDILHVPTFGNLSAVKQAREAIGLGLALEKHAAKLDALIGNV